MFSQAGGRKCISISPQTKDGLDSIKHAGQSYNGLIQELVKFWRDHQVKRRKDKNI